MLLEDALGLLERGANGHGDEIFLRHHGADRERMILLEAQVAVGKDSGEARAAGDGQAGDAVLGHDLEGLAEGDVRRDGDGVHDHAAFRTLHAVHFLSLAVHGHVAVNHADAALAGDGDGETRFGDRVHGRGGQRHVQRDFSREAGPGIHFSRQDRGFARQEQHVVKRQPLENLTVNHRYL